MSLAGGKACIGGGFYSLTLSPLSAGNSTSKIARTFGFLSKLEGGGTLW